MKRIEEIKNHYKGVWFCTCKDKSHTTGCTRTTNRKMDDLVEEILTYIKEELVPEEKELKHDTTSVDSEYFGHNNCRNEMLRRLEEQNGRTK